MIIERRIRINEIDYYIGIELKYGIKKNLQKKDGSYFDPGDLSHLIKNVEENFQQNCDYDKDITYMNDIIYIYDRFSFLSYIKTILWNKDNQIIEMDIIYKNEIDDYIKLHNITVGKFNGEDSICPMLFK